MKRFSAPASPVGLCRVILSSDWPEVVTELLEWAGLSVLGILDRPACSVDVCRWQQKVRALRRRLWVVAAPKVPSRV